MLNTKFVRATSAIVGSFALLAVLATGCGGQGDTDGGPGRDDAGPGEQFVSDGAAGSTLKITVEGDINTGETVPFKVTAIDPNGQPLQFIRIFCETEHGVAIIEPSRGGVAFEHTNASGIMSGVLGGLTPGSFLIECRAPQGFNLVDRIHVRVSGDVPEGFGGFPGAAGGNLGGGVLVEEPTNESIDIVEIRFATVSGDVTRNGPIDLSQIADCIPGGTAQPEPFGFDNYIVTITNNTGQRIFIETITFVVQDGRNVTSTSQEGQLTIAPNQQVDLVDSFTEFVAGTGIKTFAGTSAAAVHGTYNVQFTLTGSSADGSDFTIVKSASVTFGDVNNC